jgi:hypothetical protein
MIKSFRLLQVEQFNDTCNFVHGRGSAALLVEGVRVLWVYVPQRENCQ